ncbi:MAG TPA: hypothetical protein VMM54_09270 [Nitrospirota bacterium]|nr:hypothetical protein [Nitrospirota bacterium]
MGKEALVYLIVCVVVISSMLTSCGTISKHEARRTEDFLLEAGFTKKLATTAEEQAKLSAFKPLKMVRAEKDGEVIYVYPDPDNCKCAYVGGEHQFTEYKRLRYQMPPQPRLQGEHEANELMDDLEGNFDPASDMW